MAGGIVASLVAPHTPRIGVEANVPEFQKGLVAGLREMGERVRALQPDLFILHSSHWVCTFNWYVTAHALHEGVCIADEAVDLIPGIPYRRNGDPIFAQALCAAMKKDGIPAAINDVQPFKWDYASFVPLQYMDPDSTVPVVLLPSVICSSLEENRRVGELAHAVAASLGRRAVFISSCALSHAVLRGPDLWPTPERIELDRRFIELMVRGDVAELIRWSPDYCRAAVAEMGGRPLAGMLGAAGAMAAAHGHLQGRQYGTYAQSSGSGNASLCLMPRAAEERSAL
ncbi:hypothetical protein [Telmatospirillum sp. J64-1]|uniref:DODA-type extradiol aromatic ring-opening family dioxygenase n=1 Tax=Telmatospirillum sp. J64-1 TaxID=2502183 RepID=UPI00115F2BBD|nr:hypothetical protein [Telmatospirillum sp. J64-1]